MSPDIDHEKTFKNLVQGARRNEPPTWQARLGRAGLALVVAATGTMALTRETLAQTSEYFGWYCMTHPFDAQVGENVQISFRNSQTQEMSILFLPLHPLAEGLYESSFVLVTRDGFLSTRFQRFIYALDVKTSPYYPDPTVNCHVTGLLP